MATPLGHWIVAAIVPGRFGSGATRATAFAMFATVAADLDFIPGIIVGEVNRYHHGASHSIGAALIFAAFAIVLAGSHGFDRVRWKVGAYAFALYASHLVLDLLTMDTAWPYGQPLLWPVTGRYFAMETPPLWGISHGQPNAGLLHFARAVLSWHNMTAIARETLLLLPPVILVAIIRRRGGRRADGTVRSSPYRWRSMAASRSRRTLRSLKSPALKD